MVKEVFKNGLIGDAIANDIGVNASTMGTLVRNLEFRGLFTVLDRRNANDASDDILQASYETLAINSPNLKKLAGIGGAGPFSNDVSHAAVIGTVNVIGVNLNDSLQPMNPTFGNNASYFPWIRTMQGTNDGVVPDWSSPLGVASHNANIASNHTDLTKSAPARVQFTLWLNGSNGGSSYVQVPLGAVQRAEYLKPRNPANTSDSKNQPPEWARFAYDPNGNGLNRDAIIKVELDPSDSSPFYGTRNIN